MPNTKAQKKTMKMDATRRIRNRSLKTKLHNTLIGFEDAAASGDKAATQAELRKVIERLDKSVTKGIVHPNKAARKKSRLCRRLGTISG